jgi:hypothetical protein
MFLRNCSPLIVNELFMLFANDLAIKLVVKIGLGDASIAKIFLFCSHLIFTDIVNCLCMLFANLFLVLLGFQGLEIWRFFIRSQLIFLFFFL